MQTGVNRVDILPMEHPNNDSNLLQFSLLYELLRYFKILKVCLMSSYFNPSLSKIFIRETERVLHYKRIDQIP